MEIEDVVRPRINCVEAGLRVMLLMVARTLGQSVLNWLCYLFPLSYAALGVLDCNSVFGTSSTRHELATIGSSCPYSYFMCSVTRNGVVPIVDVVESKQRKSCVIVSFPLRG